MPTAIQIYGPHALQVVASTSSKASSKAIPPPPQPSWIGAAAASSSSGGAAAASTTAAAAEAPEEAPAEEFEEVVKELEDTERRWHGKAGSTREQWAQERGGWRKKRGGQSRWWYEAVKFKDHGDKYHSWYARPENRS